MRQARLNANAIGLGALAALLLLFAPVFGASAQQPGDRAGDAYELRLESVSETSSDGSSGNSRSTYTLVERVIAVRDSGVELEFDLPAETSADDRARNWQFPVRVFRSQEGVFELLNGPELEARVGLWLERFGMTEAACGRWTFTWTALKIECDPQSVLATLAPFDLRQSDPSDTVARIDPDQVRRERAEADVVVAEIMGRGPLAMEAALQAHAAERISGTVATAFETDVSGGVMRRTQITNVEIVGEDGSVERGTTTTTVERRLISNPQN